MRLTTMIRTGLIAALLLALAACGQPSLATTANGGPHLAFVAPPAGTTVTSPTLTVRFTLTNFRLVSARSGDAVDSGQIQLSLNGEFLTTLITRSYNIELTDGRNELKAVLIRNGKPLPGTTVTERLNASLPFVTTTQQFHMLSASWGWQEGSLPNGNLWIATTSDGGGTWTELPIPTVAEPFLATVFFLNASDGWIQTTHGVAGTPQSTIVTYRTTDGGKSWSAARFPAPPWIAGGGGIGGLTFVNPSVGWFTAGAAPATAQGLIAVYRTTDGGRSWTVISVGSTLVYFVKRNSPVSASEFPM
ncbi:MAG: WD40/YVTN/BNR-like repeat-containing protein [Sulfobacillus sp.]